MTSRDGRLSTVLEARIAVEAVRTATVGDLAQRRKVRPNRIYAWKNSSRPCGAALRSGVGVTRSSIGTRIEKLHAKIGRSMRTISRQRFGK